MQRWYVLFCTVLLLGVGPARADTFEKLVRYRCDPAADIVSVTFHGAYNKEGEELVAGKGPEDWTPWELMESNGDPDNPLIVRMRARERSCALSNAEYRVFVFGVPGNPRVLGRCGAYATAGLTMLIEGQVLFTGTFEPKDCAGVQDSVITSVSMRPGYNGPEIIRVKPEEFYR